MGCDPPKISILRFPKNPAKARFANVKLTKVLATLIGALGDFFPYDISMISPILLFPTDPQYIFTGWWFATWILFFHILGRISPTDELIFFRGVGLNQQAVHLSWHSQVFLVSKCCSWVFHPTRHTPKIEKKRRWWPGFWSQLLGMGMMKISPCRDFYGDKPWSTMVYGDLFLINGDENFTCRDFTGINHGQPWFIGILIILYYTGRCW